MNETIRQYERRLSLMEETVADLIRAGTEFFKAEKEYLDGVAEKGIYRRSHKLDIARRYLVGSLFEGSCVVEGKESPTGKRLDCMEQVMAGSGCKFPDRFKPCPDCDGMGYHTLTTGEAPNRGGGPTCSPTTSEETCRECGGLGYVPISWDEEGYEDGLEELED